jgi:hypothetical protein
MKLSAYEKEMYELMDQQNAEEEERILQMERELWAAMDEENEREHQQELELWRLIDEENDREHQQELELWALIEEENKRDNKEDISIWVEVIEGRNEESEIVALSNFDKAPYKALDRAIPTQGVLFKTE